MKEDDLFVKTWVCNRTVFKNIGFATGRVKLGATFSTACQLKNDKVLITRACPEVGYVFAAAASSCVTSVAKHRICVGCQCLKYDSVFVLLALGIKAAHRHRHVCTQRCLHEVLEPKWLRHQICPS